MSTADCESIIRDHLRLVEEDLGCRPLPEGQLLLTTPYTYADGDNVDVVAILRGQRLTLLDDGQAMSRLELAGVNPESRTVRSRFDALMKQLPIEHVDSELCVEGAVEQAGTLLMTLVTAMREIDALQALRPKAQPIPFQQRLLTHLHAVSKEVSDHPTLTGQSGSRYRLTAAIGSEQPVYVQAVAGGASVSGQRSVNHAFRAFYDIDGALEPAQRLAVLSEEQNWRRGDIALLQQVAFVAAWWQRDALDSFLIDRRVPESRLLFSAQAEFQ